MASVVALLVIAAVAAAPVYGKDYTVGDSQGWTSGVDYTTWAKGKTFNVGDTLTFQYGSLHNVDEVSSKDYSSCSSSNSIQSYSDQNTKITLSKAGTRYFICGSPGHCTNGMKLAVTVSDAAAAAPAPSTPKATPAAPSDDTPSTTPKTSTPTSTPATESPKSTTTTTSTKSTTNTSGALVSGPAKGLVVGVLVALGLAFMG
ncbi:Blue copper protein [Rhynchospora pubera]|uniref:Blue copper protein n=1 Tax=Rhynchospora pubera TaxID=906938 RepID=A0AAV8CYI7_9POAL|nr:Blue copper protein [Rhynchospora pubera]KAJ4811639.1 Blue copper protein [Rhynchospora pubera]